MRQVFKKLHLWLSVPFGIVLTLVCFSGAMLVFEPEVNRVALADLYDVDSSVGEALPMEQIMAIAVKSIPDSVEITGVTVAADNPNRAYRVNLSKPKRASLWIDQYTGEVKGMNRRLPFFQTMFYLHRWLLQKEKPADGGIWWGKMIVGTSVLAFVVVLISGIVIWWPRSKSAMANRFKVCFGKGRMRLTHDLHVSLGIYAVIFLLACSLTGLTWSFQWYNKAVNSAFGCSVEQRGDHRGDHRGPQGRQGHGERAERAERADRGERGERGERSERAERAERPNLGALASLDAFREISEQNPGRDITLSMTDGSVSVSLAGGAGNQRAADRYTINPATGRIAAVQRYADTDTASRLRGWIYTIHVGSWGGLFSRILTFFAVLIGTTLPITGYILWIRRLTR